LIQYAVYNVDAGTEGVKWEREDSGGERDNNIEEVGDGAQQQ
jgi:hypothetical protein